MRRSLTFSLYRITKYTQFFQFTSQSFINRIKNDRLLVPLRVTDFSSCDKNRLCKSSIKTSYFRKIVHSFHPHTKQHPHPYSHTHHGPSPYDHFDSETWWKLNEDRSHFCLHSVKMEHPVAQHSKINEKMLDWSIVDTISATMPQNVHKKH